MLKTIINFPIICVIRIYQNFVSPLLPHSCRHVPSCSQYALIAVKEHGITRGVWLGLKRIFHCHPWGTSGYDPVPGKNKA